MLKTWLAERHGEAHDLLFPTSRGGRLSRDTVQWLITKHVAAAAHRCPSLATKHITPHVLRHTCAMNLRQAGVDVSVIALWLGHDGIETTSIYLNADLRIKEQALARTAPPGTSPPATGPPTRCSPSSTACVMPLCRTTRHAHPPPPATDTHPE